MKRFFLEAYDNLDVGVKMKILWIQAGKTNEDLQ